MPFKALILLSVFAFFLSACGGAEYDTESSTSDSSTVANTSSNEPALFEGQAAKGVVQYGDVDAYVLEQGTRRHVGSTQTDDEGQFSLTVSDFSGPVIVEITPAADGSSTMTCDAVGGCNSATFGEQLPLPDDFLISTLIIPQDSDLSSIAVTPLTHLVAEWAQAMPGEVTEQAVELARRRVAGILEIDAGFAFHNVPDITDQQALDNADAASQRHSLMAAAFSEQAADTNDSLQEVISGYVQTLLHYAGQLEHYGDYSLHALFASAYEIADTRNILTSTKTSLGTRIASLSAGVSDVATTTAFDQQAFDTALVTLDDIGYYLGEAGIDESGTFFSSNAQQTSWLDNAETLSLIDYALDAALGSAVFAVSAGVYEGLPNRPDTLSTTYGPDRGLSLVYTFDTEELVITGETEGQAMAITIKVDPVNGVNRVYEYDIQGTIQNSVSTLSLDGKLTVDFYSTDIASLIGSLRDGLSTVEGVVDEIKRTVSDMHARATFDGTAGLLDTSNDSSGFWLNQISAWSEWNIPSLENGGSLFAKEIGRGEFITPGGDWISDNPDSAAPAFSAEVGGDSQMQADFLMEAFGLPVISVQAQGSIGNTGSLIDSYADKLGLFMSAPLELNEIITMLPKMDFSVLDVAGSANIEIEDMERGVRSYEFNLGSSRIDVSLPNSVDNAFSLHLTAGMGAYITSGDTLVATVTFGGKNLGGTLYLVDGTRRGYYLGELADFISPEILQAFQELRF